MAVTPLQSAEQEVISILRSSQPAWTATVTASTNPNHQTSVGPRLVGVRRSGPRSRAGCLTCKQRRVRCDENHPICGHCLRLQLKCYYRPQAERSRARAPGMRTRPSPNPSIHLPGPQGAHSTQQSMSNPLMASFLPNNGEGSNSGDPSNPELWSYGRSFNYPDLASDLSTSWADEFSCFFPEGPNIPSSTLATEHDQDIDVRSSTFNHLTGTVPGAATNSGADTPLAPQPTEVAPESLSQGSLPQSGRPARRSASPRGNDQALFREDSSSEPNNQSAELIRHFLRITQPPAAILIGGQKRWRCLQEYLCRISERCRAVEDALLCVVGLLTIGETCKELVAEREEYIHRIYDRYQHACDYIKAKMAQHGEPKPQTTEYLLAAIFLLAWFEVIHDQDDGHSLFPRDLADSVISSKATWSRCSQELLSWMNTLDSKAAHLAGEHLLSQQTIDMISHYQTQITSTGSLDGGASSIRFPSDTPDGTPTDSNFGSASEFDFPQIHRLEMNNLITQQGQVKQAVLNAILQPALQWYLTSQAYCRRISAHDMYHRRRSSSDDEYEIITACKQLESELSEHWNFRPSVISLTAEQLTQVVSPDLATRLEEIFSVYLASFWALFVYLHRVSWWNLPHPLPHSDLMRGALTEMWRTLQRAYGEVIEGTTKKVVHPSLLWPLFLFGCESVDLKQREWTIQQLEDLGEIKPVLEDEDSEAEILPPFRMSSGATRNAKRAAILLTKLVEEQDRQHCKIDARELSMKLFGCHFSLV